MSIDKEVGSNKFSSNFHKVVVNLYYTYKWYEQHIEEVFKSNDVLSQHFNVLKIVNGKTEPCSIKDIKEVIMDKGSDITRLIDKLVKKDLMVRELNPENRRQMLISITPKGANLVKEIDIALINRIQELNCLTESEAEELSALLDKVRTSQ